MAKHGIVEFHKDILDKIKVEEVMRKAEKAKEKLLERLHESK